MTQDDILRMAREAVKAGTEFIECDYWILSEKSIVRFANLVAEAEREACEKACESVRAAHKEWEDLHIADECVAAIRARGEK